MSEEIIPVVPLDDAPLSDSLLNHLSKKRQDTGRYIFFWDIQDLKKSNPAFSSITKAQAIAKPDQPYLAIVVDMSEMSRSNYAPSEHDPFIAHEAEHLSLWIEGYRPISLKNQPDSVQWAIDAVSNWIADPLINQRIKTYGFDMTNDRITEIEDSIKGLNKGAWKNKPITNSIRLGTSLLLEPNIPTDIKRSFRLAIRKGLKSVCVKTIFDLYRTINPSEITSPEIHDATIVKCFEILSENLRISINQPQFSPEYAKYTYKQIENWEKSNITKTKKWP